MEPIIIVVFLGVFTVVALVAVATGSGANQRAKQALATLDSALATESPAERDQILNVRKDEMLSAIPWLNKKLLGIPTGAACLLPAFVRQTSSGRQEA